MSRALASIAAATPALQETRTRCALKGRPARDLPRRREPRTQSPDHPDAHQAPARRAGDRAGRRAPTGRRPSRRIEKLLELGPDAEAENRLAKSLWELGELAEAREHYQTALALDPTNRIAERNIDRLKMLLVAAGEKTVAGRGRQQGARLDLRRGDRQDRLRAPHGPGRPASELAQVNPGDAVELIPEGNHLIASQQRRCGSASSSRASPRVCSSSSPTATSTPPA